MGIYIPQRAICTWVSTFHRGLSVLRAEGWWVEGCVGGCRVLNGATRMGIYIPQRAICVLRAGGWWVEGLGGGVGGWGSRGDFHADTNVSVEGGGGRGDAHADMDI